KGAIKDIKNIITNGSTPEAKTTPIRALKAQANMTHKQKKVMHLRTEKQYSFAAISKELNLSIQEVHQQFMAAYKLLQHKQNQQQSA
ncbi:MAG: sigma-70 family RNA polymerase sigma factor, partial [Bacteroidota bacterium]|nr:sigma-70 family RNA polymerase sigma factor [Bacteroidota bacterium]